MALLMENLKVVYSEIFKNILSLQVVKAKVDLLTEELQYILALPLETSINYIGGIYEVDISQLIPIDADPPAGRVFKFRFYIHRHYVRLHILVIPPCLRRKGYGRSIWRLFHSIWKDSFQSYELLYKNDRARRFWEKVGFKADKTSCPSIVYDGITYGSKMIYTEEI